MGKFPARGLAIWPGVCPGIFFPGQAGSLPGPHRRHMRVVKPEARVRTWGLGQPIAGASMDGLGLLGSHSRD
jgi:hypothetical protein